MSEQPFEDLRYQKNFLTNVILRLDFPSRPETIDSSADNFRQEVKEEFPIFEQKPLYEYVAKLEKGVKTDTYTEYKHYQVSDKNKEKKISLSHNFVVLEFLKYKDLDDFYRHSELLVSTINKLYPELDFTRIGLRYINQIVLEKGNPFNWKEYIDSSLTYAVDNFFNRNPNLSRAMSQIILNCDDYKLNFNYGIVNSEFPARIARKEYVLDYDCFSEFVEKEKILPAIKIFNSEIKKMFERSIKPGLRKIMGVIE